MSIESLNPNVDETKTNSLADFFADLFPGYKPYVRYGYYDEGPKQEPRLRSLHAPIPEWAVFASPIYFLSPSQIDRLESLWQTPSATKGCNNIAIELQDECEASDRVLYPVLAESDALEEDCTFEELVRWLQDFARDVLGVPPDVCWFYYTGSRSIHLHTPLFFRHDELTSVKRAAEAFNEEKGAELDTCIYSRKRQFRLPGAVHHKTDRRKLQLDPEDPNGSVARRIQRGEVETHETFGEFLEDLYDPYLRSGGAAFWQCLTTQVIDDSTGHTGSVHPRGPAEQAEKDAYDAHEFSPYANADNGGQSVVAFRVYGEPFEEDTTHVYSTLVPAYIFAGHGCTGKDYYKYKEHAPIQLSKRDAKKWDFDEDEIVVLIGGKSRSSRIFAITEEEAEVLVDGHLHYEHGDRLRALEYLANRGYDVGKGRVRTKSKPNPERVGSDTSKSSLTENSPAAKLQRRAERKGISALSHEERRKVAFRLLTRDWDVAWNWFVAQYGDDFKPEITRRAFITCIKAFPEDYKHIRIPDQ
ncbi:hypothetical protein [Halorubellus sp. PRR65]|uniref:hypothetical protein n=1 Tax=Halorubellus sp. PRR65 TaxID=3098148 RepID=UPI002B2568BD|nr:hypothetical protein [Halorubellus sp. PRR65]